MKRSNATWMAALVLSLAVTAGLNPPAGVAGTFAPQDTVTLNAELGEFPSAAESSEPLTPAPRPSLSMFGLQSAADSDIGVPLYEQDLDQGDYGFYVMPQGLIYRSYLAGPKEPRMSAGIVSIPDDSTMWDATIGGRLGMFRIGNSDSLRPRGFQMDVEAAAMLRLDIPENVDVRAADYRVGFPLTWGDEFRQWKFSYYHMSSHLGDEYWEDNPEFPLYRQARDALVLGHSLYLTDSLRIYGEVGWAFYSVASEPWEVQFGLDYAPRVATGLRGAPFFAANGYLREEFDFG
ncbi:MAG: DUF1207 domain-containing protein, partial [Pirellulaceae bacterium]|nr:DUF1207 domain-containing protein [Pirellulaceae bacterium]